MADTPEQMALDESERRGRATRAGLVLEILNAVRPEDRAEVMAGLLAIEAATVLEQFQIQQTWVAIEALAFASGYAAGRAAAEQTAAIAMLTHTPTVTH
jgi:hypothetical protein